MGSDNPQNTPLNLLKAWLNLSRLQAQALTDGDFDKLEQLIATGAAIQARLEQCAFAPDADEKVILREIDTIQQQILDELSKGSQEINSQLSSLRHNINAIGGYRTQASGPSFLNKRT